MYNYTYVIAYNVGGYGSEGQDVLIRFSATKQVMDEIDVFRKEMEQKQEMFYFIPLLQFIESRVTGGVQLFFSRESLSRFDEERWEKEQKEPRYNVTLPNGKVIKCETSDTIFKRLINTEFENGRAVVLTMESVARCSYCGNVRNVQEVRKNAYGHRICLNCIDYYETQLS